MSKDSLTSQVDDMRWQMGLQMNCSATDWLNSTSTASSGTLRDGRLWLVTLILLVTTMVLWSALCKKSVPSLSQSRRVTSVASVQQRGHDGADGRDGLWHLQPHWQDPSESGSQTSNSQSQGVKEDRDDNFLGEEFGPGSGELVQGEMAEGVLHIEIPTLSLEPARALSPVNEVVHERHEMHEMEVVRSPSMVPTLHEPIDAPGSDRPMVWFAGPEGPRRALTEADLLPEPKELREEKTEIPEMSVLNLVHRVHLLEEEKAIDDWQEEVSASWWGFSRTGRWADEVLADEEGLVWELPNPSTFGVPSETPEMTPSLTASKSSHERAGSWPAPKEKPSRSQQRRRQRKNSKAKGAGTTGATGASSSRSESAAPAIRVLQLEQLLMLPPQPRMDFSPFKVEANAFYPSEPEVLWSVPAPALAPAPAPSPAASSAPTPPAASSGRRRRSRPRPKRSAPLPTLPPRSGRAWHGRRSVEAEQDETKKSTALEHPGDGSWLMNPKFGEFQFGKSLMGSIGSLWEDLICSASVLHPCVLVNQWFLLVVYYFL